MDRILPYFQNSIRLSNLVKFARNRGLTVYYQVKEALEKYPDFDWPLVYSRAKTDFINYGRAKRLVRDRPYYGYNADIGVAAATNYPTLGYVSISLNRIVGGQSTLETYASAVNRMINKEIWDKIVRAYRDGAEGANLSTEERALVGQEWVVYKTTLRDLDRDDQPPPDNGPHGRGGQPPDTGNDDNDEDAPPGGGRGMSGSGNSRMTRPPPHPTTTPISTLSMFPSTSRSGAHGPISTLSQQAMEENMNIDDASDNRQPSDLERQVIELAAEIT